MVSALWTAALVGLGVAVILALAELAHARRVRRVAHLAFGSSGRPRAWTRAVPVARIVATATLAWGLAVLASLEPEVVDARPTKKASQHLLVCLDASPSMFVADAGPSGDQKRAVWAGELAQAILDRLDVETTRVTVFAIYTGALPVVEDTFDTNIVRNLFDGLPLFSAFEPGPTKLAEGVEDAMEYARSWEPGSATLVVISDGDADAKRSVRFTPKSIADSIVIGVGDPKRPSMVAGHRSKQESASLRALARQLGGVYHQGNTKHLPSAVLDALTMIQPRVTDGVGLRTLALFAVGLGGALVALIGPALGLVGRASAHARAVREPVQRRVPTLM